VAAGENEDEQLCFFRDAEPKNPKRGKGSRRRRGNNPQRSEPGQSGDNEAGGRGSGEGNRGGRLSFRPSEVGCDF